MKRDFDLIVYGATGYTGHLVAEYLATSYRGDNAPSWAIAGRSTDKLQKVRADIGAPNDLPLVKADAAEPASLRSMCERAAAIITTVGPYQLHGPELVAACAATGTAYVDLCGEPAWMRRMSCPRFSQLWVAERPTGKARREATRNPTRTQGSSRRAYRGACDVTTLLDFVKEALDEIAGSCGRSAGRLSPTLRGVPVLIRPIARLAS